MCGLCSRSQTQVHVTLIRTTTPPLPAIATIKERLHNMVFIVWNAIYWGYRYWYLSVIHVSMVLIVHEYQTDLLLLAGQENMHIALNNNIQYIMFDSRIITILHVAFIRYTQCCNLRRQNILFPTCIYIHLFCACRFNESMLIQCIIMYLVSSV